MPRSFFFLPFIFLSFYSSSQFTMDNMGHVNGESFSAFLKKNNIQLCGAFTAQRVEKKTQYFAMIVKDSLPMYLDITGKIYRNGDEVRKAFGMREMEEDFERINYGDRETYDVAAEPVPFENEGSQYRYYDYKKNYQFTEEGKKGYVFNGKKILPAVYDQIMVMRSQSEISLIITQNDLQGAADTNGRILIEPRYERVDRTTESDKFYFKVQNEGKEAFFDKNGNISIPFQPYKMLYMRSYIKLSEGNYPNMRQGIMDTTGKIVIEPVFSSVSQPSRYSAGESIPYNVFIVSSGKRGHEKNGLMDLKGNVLLDTVYSDIEYFKRDLYKFEKDSYGSDHNDGIYNMATQKMILPAEYSFDSFTFEDTILFSRMSGEKKLFGLLGPEGQIIVPANYEYLHLISEHKLLITGNGNEYALTDLKLNRVIPQTFEALHPMRGWMETSSLPSDLLIAKLNGKNGIIDIKGKTIIPFEYEKITPNNFGLMATKEGKIWFLDLSGKVLSVRNDDLSYMKFNNGIIEGRNNQGKQVFADLYGNEISLKNLRWK